MNKIRRVLVGCILVTLLSFGFIGKGYSQYSIPRDAVMFHKSIDFGMAAGANMYFGQVKYKTNDVGFALSPYLRYNALKWLSLRLNLEYLRLGSHDDYWGRQFTTNGFNINTRLEFNVLSGTYPHSNSLYLFGGIGAMFSSGTYERYEPGNRDIITSTEKYSNVGLDLSLGLGFKYRVIPSLVLGVELASHFVVPDNFDNVTSKSVEASNATFDYIQYVGVTIGYNITFYKSSHLKRLKYRR